MTTSSAAPAASPDPGATSATMAVPMSPYTAFAQRGPDMRAFLAPADGNVGYQQRWGSNLTPMVLTSAMRNADVGNMTQFADLLDELRETDPHLHAVLQKRELVVAGAEWEVRPAAVYDGVEEPEEARRVRALCETALRQIPALPDRLADLLGGIYYGRAVTEVVWDQSEGCYWPVQLRPVHPRWVHFGPDWKLYLWGDAAPGQPLPFGPWPGLCLSDFPRGKFVVHQPRVRGGFAAREGLGRPLAWYCMFKRWVVRDAMALAELAGRMARIGTYKTGADGGIRASNEDVERLERTLKNWTSATALVHPDTTAVKMEKPVSGDTIHEPLFNIFNTEISKTVLGETLTTDAGSRGARSLGEVHAQQGRMIARYDAQALAETIRRYVLAPLVLYNFGPHVPVPRLAFSVDPQESMDALADRLAKLVPLGLEVPQQWVRDQLGVQDPKPGDRLLGVTVPVVTPSVAGDTVPVVWPMSTRIFPTR